MVAGWTLSAFLLGAAAALAATPAARDTRWNGTFAFDATDTPRCHSVGNASPLSLVVSGSGRVQFAHLTVFAVDNDWVWHQSGADVRLDTANDPKVFFTGSVQGSVLSGRFYAFGCYGTFQLNRR